MRKYFFKSEVISIIFQTYKQISLKRRKLIFFCVLLMILSGFFEFLTIGSLLPVLTSFSNPEDIFNNKLYGFLLGLFNIKSGRSIIYFNSMIFILLVIISNIFRILTLYINAKSAALISSDISCKAYQNTLFQPYQIHLERNTSDIITNLITGTQQIVGTLNSSLRVLYSSVNFIFVFIALLLIDTKIAVVSLLTFSLIYFLVIVYFKKLLRKKSSDIYNNNLKIVKLIQESFGSIKNIILDNSHDFFFEEYKRNDIAKRKKEADIDLLGILPYSLIEGLALISIIIIGLTLSKSSGTLAILGTIGLGLQRLLRSVQQFYASYVFVQGRVASLSQLILYLNIDVDKYLFSNNKNIFNFRDSIKLHNLKFKYNEESIIDNLNLEIKKGEMVGIKGETGSGKSTLINIIMGLLIPTEGYVLVDGINLNKKENQLIKSSYFNSISHVAQDIFLFNVSFAENIAFGIPLKDIDFDRVKKVAKEACIYDFISSTSRGFLTVVAERGINLSGGQKQRIGIARALYKNSKILVLDEATSALDHKTEFEVMKSIKSKKNDLTIIMIAHRLSTLEQCSSIIQV